MLTQINKNERSCFVNFFLHDPLLLTLSQSKDKDSTVNKTSLTNLYPPTKGYLRETCKSQNINPIYLTLSSPSVSFTSKQTPVKYVLVLSLIKSILTSAQFQYLTFKLNLEVKGVCKFKVLPCM